MREDASADDEVERRMEFEQEKFTGHERVEIAVAGRLPEVGLLKVRDGLEVLEPIEIGDADVSSHRTPPFDFGFRILDFGFSV